MVEEGGAQSDGVLQHDGPVGDVLANADASSRDGATPRDSSRRDSAASDATSVDGAVADAAAVGDQGDPDGAQGGDTGTGARTVSATLAADADAISAYLMVGTAWNLFYGATVYLGRRPDAPNVSYHTALRFTDVAIPPGATILSARLSFHGTNEVDSTNNLWINVYAERAANSAPFDPANYKTNRPDQRLKTTAHIDHWLLRCNDACTDLSEFNCPQRKLDCWNRNTRVTVPHELTSIVQEVVDGANWAAGNALTLLLVNAATDQDGAKYTKSRTITGYDPARGTQFAPRLEVTYEL